MTEQQATPDPAPQRCGAKNRQGGKCKLWPLKNSKRCGLHGGLTPKGPDSPHWKHGQTARHVPKPLNEQYQAALADPQLMQFQHDAALIEALRRSLTSRIDLGKAVPVTTEKRLLELSDALRKVKESEQRRLRDLQLMVPLEQHRRAMILAADTVVRVLTRNADSIRAAFEAAGVDPKLVALLNPGAWQAEMQAEMRAAVMRVPALVIDVTA